MGTIRGFVGESSEDGVRIYLEDEPHRYFDVPYSGIEGVVAGHRTFVADVSVSEATELREGRLDEDSFRQLFSVGSAPQAYRTFYCDSGFWRCKHSREIC